MLHIFLFFLAIVVQLGSFSHSLDNLPDGNRVIVVSLDYFNQSISSLNKYVFAGKKNDHAIINSENFSVDEKKEYDVENIWSSSSPFTFKIGFIPSIYWVQGGFSKKSGSDTLYVTFSGDNTSNIAVENLFKLGLIFFGVDYQKNDRLNLGGYTALSTMQNRLNYFDHSEDKKYELSEFVYVINGNVGYDFPEIADIKSGISYILKSYTASNIDQNSSNDKKYSNLHSLNVYGSANFADLKVSDNIAFTNFIDSSIIVSKNFNSSSYGDGSITGYQGFIFEYNAGLKSEIDSAMGIISFNPSLILGFEVPNIETADTGKYLRFIDYNTVNSRGYVDVVFFGGEFDIKFTSFNSWGLDFNIRFVNLQKSYLGNVGIVISI